jgi:ankyrin repeat protein
MTPSSSPPFSSLEEANSALFFATMTGSVDEAREALEVGGASPLHANKHGLTPLHVCAGGVGPAEMLRLLIAHGADVNGADLAGWTPLVLVSSTGQVHLLDILVEAGADPNLSGADARARGARERDPSLAAAAAAGADEGGLLLGAGAGAAASALARAPAEAVVGCDEGAGGTGEGGWRWTPLTRAAFRGQTRAVRRLLEVGADPQACVTDGKRAVELARAGGHAEAVEVLEEWGRGGE